MQEDSTQAHPGLDKAVKEAVERMKARRQPGITWRRKGESYHTGKPGPSWKKHRKVARRRKIAAKSRRVNRK